MIKFLDIYLQDLSLRPAIDAAIASVINDSAFISGPRSEAFCREFAVFQQADYCIGVGNGTDALEIILQALNLPVGGEVLVPANSFIASAEAVTRSGLKVVFCDCDPDTYTLDLADAEQRITHNTAAIIPVHLYGHPCDMEAITALAQKHGLYVIEDCAQAHGAEYKGRRLGTFGVAGAFSFYPGKNLGAYGDAGAIVTNDSTLAERCQMLANHGRADKYNHRFEGRNSRLDGIQAAILSTKLQYLDAWNTRRREIANLYIEQLQGVDLILPRVQSWAEPVWHLFVVRTPQRDELQAALARQGIQTGVHYPIALPQLDAYRHLNQQQYAPRASGIAQQLLSLPMGPHLSDNDIVIVTRAIRDFFHA
jgi:dTDP-4-amino-4,6-dideoxygalactose transaminase